MEQFYFSIYKRIESDVIDIASTVLFCDEQLNVYSTRIADVIIRCAVEIESIVKEMYRREFGKEPDSPGACIIWMNEKWKLEKRQVLIDNPIFRFKKINVMKPFDYRRGTKEDYYSAYNAIKHDRMKNIEKANVETMMRTLAALYLLELYYLEEKYYFHDASSINSMDKTGGSRIFSFLVATLDDRIILSSKGITGVESCLYRINRKESDYAITFSYLNRFGESETRHLVRGDAASQEYLMAHDGKKLNEEELQGVLQDVFSMNIDDVRKNLKTNKIISARIQRMRAFYCAELNQD